MASYNGDFNRMQEEALSRLREMQKRSKTAVNRPQPEQPPPPEPRPRPAQQRQSPRQPAPSADPLRALLGDIKIDSEKALILLMLFVLYKNNADLKLLLALGYLLI